MIERGRAFFKMSGSGNDFVFFDARNEAPGELTNPARVAAICARATGVGADGIVFLESSRQGDVRMTYLNADGSRAMCGNATLCSARLAVELGQARPDALTIETDAGLVKARMRGGQPEIDLQPPTEVMPEYAVALAPGERKVGYADTGVPHLVIRTNDVDVVDVVGRGRPLRYLGSLPRGANVNFVSADPDGTAWRMRTYERGVEAETLACGTGAVAAAILLRSWGVAGAETALITRSGRQLRVRLGDRAGQIEPSLSGEARIVFTGVLSEA